MESKEWASFVLEHARDMGAASALTLYLKKSGKPVDEDVPKRLKEFLSVVGKPSDAFVLGVALGVADEIDATTTKSSASFLAGLGVRGPPVPPHKPPSRRKSAFVKERSYGWALEGFRGVSKKAWSRFLGSLEGDVEDVWGEVAEKGDVEALVGASGSRGVEEVVVSSLFRVVEYLEGRGASPDVDVWAVAFWGICSSPSEVSLRRSVVEAVLRTASKVKEESGDVSSRIGRILSRAVHFFRGFSLVDDLESSSIGNVSKSEKSSEPEMKFLRPAPPPPLRPSESRLELWRRQPPTLATVRHPSLPKVIPLPPDLLAEQLCSAAGVPSFFGVCFSPATKKSSSSSSPSLLGKYCPLEGGWTTSRGKFSAGEPLQYASPKLRVMDERWIVPSSPIPVFQTWTDLIHPSSTPQSSAYILSLRSMRYRAEGWEESVTVALDDSLLRHHVFRVELDGEGTFDPLSLPTIGDEDDNSSFVETEAAPITLRTPRPPWAVTPSGTSSSPILPVGDDSTPLSPGTDKWLLPPPPPSNRHLVQSSTKSSSSSSSFPAPPPPPASRRYLQAPPSPSTAVPLVPNTPTPGITLVTAPNPISPAELRLAKAPVVEMKEGDLVQLAQDVIQDVQSGRVLLPKHDPAASERAVLGAIGLTSQGDPQAFDHALGLHLLAAEEEGEEEEEEAQTATKSKANEETPHKVQHAALDKVADLLKKPTSSPPPLPLPPKKKKKSPNPKKVPKRKADRTATVRAAAGLAASFLTPHHTPDDSALEDVMYVAQQRREELLSLGRHADTRKLLADDVVHCLHTSPFFRATWVRINPPKEWKGTAPLFCTLSTNAIAVVQATEEDDQGDTSPPFQVLLLAPRDVVTLTPDETTENVHLSLQTNFPLHRTVFATHDFLKATTFNKLCWILQPTPVLDTAPHTPPLPAEICSWVQEFSK